MDKKHGLTGKPSNNAGKTKHNAKKTHFGIRCEESDRSLYEEAAEKLKVKSSDWARTTLSKEAKKVLNNI